MAVALTLTPVRIAMSEALEVLRDNITANAEARDLNATGGTIRSIATRSLEIGSVAVVGELSAESQWKFVGNGRGPGRMPPIDSIQRWIDARGLDITAWAVARKIAKAGSRDHRLKRANVFEQSIETWQQDGLEGVIDAAAQTTLDTAATIIVRGIEQKT